MVEVTAAGGGVAEVGVLVVVGEGEGSGGRGVESAGLAANSSFPRAGLPAAAAAVAAAPAGVPTSFAGADRDVVSGSIACSASEGQGTREMRVLGGQ